MDCAKMIDTAKPVLGAFGAEMRTCSEGGPVLAVRPYVHTGLNRQVYFDTHPDDPEDVRRRAARSISSLEPRRRTWDSWTDCWAD